MIACSKHGIFWHLYYIYCTIYKILNCGLIVHSIASDAPSVKRSFIYDHRIAIESSKEAAANARERDTAKKERG